MDGLPTAKGTFNWDGITAGQLGWAGVGQYHDQVNPCAFLLWMGAIANGGKAAEPYLIRKRCPHWGSRLCPITQHTGQLIDSRTAATVADFMANNVTETYGTKRFPNMELCAKIRHGGGGDGTDASRLVRGLSAERGCTLRLCGAGGKRRRRKRRGRNGGRQGAERDRQRILKKKKERRYEKKTSG